MTEKESARRIFLNTLRERGINVDEFIEDYATFVELIKDKKLSSSFGNLQRVLDICQKNISEDDSLSLQYFNTGAIVFIESDDIVIPAKQLTLLSYLIDSFHIWVTPEQKVRLAIGVPNLFEI